MSQQQAQEKETTQLVKSEIKEFYISDESTAAEIEALKLQNKELNEKLTSLQNSSTQEIKNLNEKNTKLNQELTVLQSQLKEQQQKEISSQNELKQKVEKIEQLEKDLQKQISDQKVVQDNCNRFQNANNLKEQQLNEAQLKLEAYINDHKDQVALSDNLKNLKQEHSSLQKDFSLLKKICQESDLGKVVLGKFENTKNEQQNPKESSQIAQKVQNLQKIDKMQGYDLQIKFESVKQLIQHGAEIDLRFSRDSTEYQDATSRKQHLIGFLGLKNSGKSYLHSILTNQIIQQGNLHATQGLNVSFKEKYCMADTRGLGETLQHFTEAHKLREKYNEYSKLIEEDKNLREKSKLTKEEINKMFEEKKDIKNRWEKEVKELISSQNEVYKEKLALENFIQSFILENADVIIYVADILNLEEQRYINQISQQIKTNNKHQQLIVCHNLKTIDNVQDFRQCIEKDIYKNFSIELDEQLDFDKCYYKDFGLVQDGDQHFISQTTHLVFGKEGSPIEELYNKKSVEHIFTLLKNFSKMGKSQNIFESFQAYTNKNIQRYIVWDKLKLEPSEISSLQVKQFQNDEDEQKYQQKQSKSSKTSLPEVPGPEFQIDYESMKIHSMPHQCVIKKSIFCKEILTNFLGQQINEFDQADANCLYSVYVNEVKKGKFIKTILFSVPGITMIRKVNVRISADNNKGLKICHINVQYNQEKLNFFEQQKIDEKGIEKNYDIKNPLILKDKKFDIPISAVDQNYNSSSLKKTYLKEQSLYRIDMEFNNDDYEQTDSEDFDSAGEQN